MSSCIKPAVGLQKVQAALCLENHVYILPVAQKAAFFYQNSVIFKSNVKLERWLFLKAVNSVPHKNCMTAFSAITVFFSILAS